MKSLFIYAIVFFHCVKPCAQTIGEIKVLVDKGDFAVAKKAIDSYLADEKNAAKPDGWYYKGFIYNECSKKEEWVKLCTNCKLDAFSAFKKYQELDPKNVYMVLEQNVRLFDLYNGFFDQASKYYAGKNFIAAYENFNHALMVENYIYKKGFEYNGFKFSNLDTALILNMALSARLAKDDDKAVKNYQRLAEINLGGPEYLEMYQYLAQYYADTRNATALNDILKKGKKLYPAEDYWTEIEIDQVDRSDKPVLFAKYEELTGKNPGNYTLAYNYCVELFNYIHVGENIPADAPEKASTLEAVLKKVLVLKNSADANALMARHLYNKVYDLQQLQKNIKGTKPEDEKQKASIKTEALRNAGECIIYASVAEKIYSAATSLKPTEKANLKNILTILESMYTYKGDKAMAEQYKKKVQ